ncbi:hypothetical protein FRC07_011804 [Ceratobasidium sp. 392]|nr:hypothetical protein FRC07_011804 [Ceratobasidium sp. 392]
MHSSGEVIYKDNLLIPELATLIAQFSTQQDCARLVQTCRTFYDVAIPSVWQYVCGVQHLLLLVDRAERLPKYSPISKEPDFYLADSFWVENPFTRFDIYAPYVKYLDIYGPKGEMFKLTGWKVLISRARRQALLPNLHTLTISSICNSNGPDQPMWVGAFASPSLVNLEVTAADLAIAPSISYSATSFIMEYLTARCPKLERLGLFPCAEIGTDAEEGEGNLLAFLSGGLFYKYTAHFTTLRHLSCTLAWFQGPPLRILGQLRHLESIDVCGIDDADDMDSELTENSFPSLRSLSLHRPHPYDATQTLWTTQMIKNLTSLYISLEMAALVNDGTEEEPLDPAGALEDIIEIDESVLEILQKLPLKSLHLGQVRLDNEALDFDFASVWPSVTRLSIPQQPAPLATISRSAVLPELQHLVLRLDFGIPTLEYDKITSPLTVLEASLGSKICYEKINQTTSRFDVYAPFVKSLDLFGPSYDYIKISGWWSLIRRNREHVLLPNLRMLEIESFCNTHGPDQAMWVQALASPSLVDLMILPGGSNNGPTISYPMTAFILNSVQELCPNLKGLSLFPNANLGDTGQDGESHFLMLLSHEPFYNYLTGINNLRTLASTTAWFRKPALSVLSRMPSLETFVVYEWNDERLDFVENSLPAQAFPSLRQLVLRLLHPYDASKLLMTQNLVRQLTALELHFDWDQLNQAINRQEWLLRKIIQPLQNMRSLNKLTLETNPGAVVHGVVEIGAEALAVFSQLPLSYVYLSGIMISSSCLDYTLGSVWPNLIELLMPMQRATLSTLPYFASLPKLYQLELLLDLRWETLPQSPPQTSSLSLIILRASIRGQNFISSGHMRLDAVARVLLFIWPNLESIEWLVQADGPVLPPDQAALYDCVKFLNVYIATLGELHKLRSLLVGTPRVTN